MKEMNILSHETVWHFIINTVQSLGSLLYRFPRFRIIEKAIKIIILKNGNIFYYCWYIFLEQHSGTNTFLSAKELQS